jgi:hypothetical protein
VPIAIRAGQLLVKDGRLQTDCSCCDQPVCGNACGPGIPSPQSVTLTISNWAGLGGATFRDYPIDGSYEVTRRSQGSGEVASDCFAYELFDRSPATCVVNQATWAFGAINYDLVILGSQAAFNVYMKNIISGGAFCFQWRAQLPLPPNGLCGSPVNLSGIASTLETTDGGVPFGTFAWQLHTNPLP